MKVKRSKEEMIDDLVNHLEELDSDILLSIAQEGERARLESVDPKEVAEEWNEIYG